ncbi:retrovirus-related pol polyprotein from transposon TNT 1-94 [Tanacetum coccineum]
MSNHVNNWKKANQEKNNESLTAELERYKERVKTFEQRLNIDLTTRVKMIDSQMDDMIKEKLAFKQQIDSLEQNLSNQIKENESLLQTFIVLKNECKEKESKYMDKEIDLEKKIKELDNIVYKVGQSAQTKAQRIKPTLYNGSVISSPHAVIPVINDEETLILEEAPRELPKVRLVNTSLKKLKYHLGKFDTVVKKRITPDAITEGKWGFEHTKAIFLNEIILFLKTLKEIFNVFDKDLLNEVTEVQTTFNQMEAAVQRCSVEKQCFEIHKKELFFDNDRHLHQIMSQDVMLCVMNSTTVFGDFVNVEMQSSDAISDKSCDNQNALEILEYFKNNDLKAQLQAKDTTICKLKEHIKSMREDDKEEKVKQDMDEIETINIELEHIYGKCGFKRSNSRKGFVTTTLQNELRGLKGKNVLDNATLLSNATTLVPRIFQDLIRSLASARITPTKVVQLKETTSNLVKTPKPEIKVYSRRPKQRKTVGSSKKAKIVESKIANNTKPNHSWGSNAIDVPSSSSLVNDRLSRLFSGSRDTNLYTISLDDMLKSSLIFLLSKASKTKSWLWHHQLSHLYFGTLNQLAKDSLGRGIPKLKFKKDHLCSTCALGKSKKSSHQPKAEDTNHEKLYLLHMDLCGPMRVESINGKKYILVIVNDYSRFTWVKFLRSKDEAPDAVIKSIKNIQVHLNAIVHNVRTDNGTEFVNQTL